MNAQSQTLDCRGMRCPAPILQLSKATRGSNQPARLKVLADDGDFPTDLRAWCRSTGAHLESLSETDGHFVADLAFPNAKETAPTPSASPVSAPVPITTVDCSGMRCPAPILAIAKASKAASGPSVMRVLATDGDFPTDAEAWCRSTKNKLFGIENKNGTFEAFIGLKGLDTLPSGVGPVQSAPVVASPQPSEIPSADLDVRADDPGMALLKIGQHSMANPAFSFVAPGSASLVGQLQAWGAAMGVSVTVRAEGDVLRGRVDRSSAPVAAPVQEVEETAMTVPNAIQAEVVPRENKATLLVLHNDFEPLMAALMVANASAAQGMKVEVYFSFWGVNLLRGPRSVPLQTTEMEKPSLLKKMMKMMMPAGPDRVQMSKMNFGGAGVGMMKHFMKQDNILSMRELMVEAADLDVKFVVCTMSMGLMGISKSDLMDLPNVEFGGVTAFSASARTAASSMVF